MMTGSNRFICFQKIRRLGLAVVFALDNIKRLVSVDLIENKNQAILEEKKIDNGNKIELMHIMTSLVICNI